MSKRIKGKRITQVRFDMAKAMRDVNRAAMVCLPSPAEMLKKAKEDTAAIHWAVTEGRKPL